MLEVILHCANGEYCVFQLKDAVTGTLRGNYLAPGPDAGGNYLTVTGVISYALQQDWQLVSRDGKGVYVCAECIEGVPYE